MRALKAVSLLALALAAVTAASTAYAGGRHHKPPVGTGAVTPIQHLVVIFQENVSFDHYFATIRTPRTRPTSRASRPAARPEGQRAEPAVPGSGQREHGPAVPSRPLAVRDLRPGPQLQRRAGAAHAGPHGPVRREGRSRRLGRAEQRQRRPSLRLRQGPGPGDGLLRRQHRHRALELRAELRDVRQLLRHDLRAVDARRINLVSGQTHGVRPDFNPTTATLGNAVTAAATIVGDPQPAGDICTPATARRRTTAT